MKYILLFSVIALMIQCKHKEKTWGNRYLNDTLASGTLTLTTTGSNRLAIDTVNTTGFNLPAYADTVTPVVYNHTPIHFHSVGFLYPKGRNYTNMSMSALIDSGRLQIMGDTTECFRFLVKEVDSLKRVINTNSKHKSTSINLKIDDSIGYIY